jgi:hypothetical protein
MAQRISDWLQGRSSVFAILFFVTGNVMHLAHRLDANYIAFMCALLGAVIGHNMSLKPSATSTMEKNVADMVNRHLPHIHSALDDLTQKAGQ